MRLNVAVPGIKHNTNILDVKVPEQLKHKKRSGIAWLDAALGGQGFTPSTSMMFTGGAGCGKTTILLQLADSLTSKGYTVLLNTGEESLYQVRMVTERLKLKHGFYVGQDTNVNDVIAHAKQLAKEHPRKQVFLLQDSLQVLDDGYYKDGGTTSNTPVRCCQLLTDWAKEDFSIVVFIGQVNKDGKFNGKNSIKHDIDVHAHLSFDSDKKSETYGERLFEVQKNRFGCTGITYIIGLGDEGAYEKGSFSAVTRDTFKAEKRADDPDDEIDDDDFDEEVKAA